MLVIARDGISWVAIARGNAEAAGMAGPSNDPLRPTGPAARLSRLRIAGFKSFADPVELAVLPGLTGIVGPNGCGKSNVADALRWAMGEGRARTLRGAEMDDVIFAGTAARPGHNRAKVALTLEGDLSAPFAGLPEVQVTRRVERGAGSAYRANGQEVRARDVQALFADLAGGARSSAMVSQGRVGALVGARPEERRLVLEEAAGIGGLQARRAEADAKLRTAAANLVRAEDARGGLDAQLAGLRRQARQAERHRDLSGRIGAAEAGLLDLARARAAAIRTAAAAALAAARAGVARAASEASATKAEAAATSAALPALREAETNARTTAGRARLAQEDRQAAAARARDALAAAATRQAQAERDLAQAEVAAGDAAGAEARLAQEGQRLAAGNAASPAQLAALQAEAADAARALQDAEAAAATAAGRRAALAAGAQALSDLLAQAGARVRRAGDAAARLRAERDRAARAAVDPARLAAAGAEAAATGAALAEAQERLVAAERARALAAPDAAAVRAAQGRADTARIHLAAEASALNEVLAAGDNRRWPPVMDQVQVPAGLEAALGAALGEGLAAAAGPGAARHWRDLPALPDRPVPGEALSAQVRAPPALSRALSGVGVVADDAAGEAAQPGLLPGQCLVSRAGALWRWDGYTVRAGTPAAATTRLRQRNRLAGLRTRLAEADAVATQARAVCTAADAAERAAAAAEAQARTAWRDAEDRASRAGQAAVTLQARADATATALAVLEAQATALAPEAEAAAKALDHAQAQRAALPDPGQLGAAADQARATLAAARTRDATAARALDGAARDNAARRARLTWLAQERADWARRAAEAAQRTADLEARRAEAGRDHARLLAEAAGATAEAEGAVLLGQAEDAHRAAAAALAAAGRRADATAQAARTADAALAQAREAQIRAEAASGQAEQAWAALPAATPQPHEVAQPAADAPPDLSAAAEGRARAELAALLRQRDALGPVNLRAAIEAAAVEAAMDAISRERDELAAAIAALRGNLGQLDREGRARLAAVFQQVDAEFQALFSRMFGGGRAHLALVGSDDPLQAGLEVYAQPPGKRLAALSLLSGGEQALTALSLVFAVFRCSPAPVCVLDEVDAPLDDANVERLCALLADMARDTATRFLVVTHHGLTMARMDRLYGVTMQERGVSRLLSVDLGQAAAWADARAAE